MVETNWIEQAKKCQQMKQSDLLQRFGELVAKMWNPRRFTSHVSPHELLQATSAQSDKRFRIGQSSNPLEFMSWFLNTLHTDLGGSNKSGSSIIHTTFQGELRIEHTVPRAKGIKKVRGGHEDEDGMMTVSKKPFLFLSLTLPPAPLFKDDSDRAFIPQVPLFDLLKRFDGDTAEIQADGSVKRYSISKLPRYLVVHIKRFKDNNWFIEKNPTLVNFPLKNLEMRPYIAKKELPSDEELLALSVPELKKRCMKRRIPHDVIDKYELVRLLSAHFETARVSTRYDLIANICHEGKPAEGGSYRVHMFHRSTDTWYEMQDLHVWTTETMPQLVALSETFLQIYERRKD